MTNAEAIKIINQYDCNFYWTDGEKIPTEDLIEAFELAVKALDAQTPRVLTLEEIKSESRDFMYLDWNRSSELGYFDIFPVLLTLASPMFIRFAERNGQKFRLKPKDYNKTWRCWSAKPTDEQRRETPWEG